MADGVVAYRALLSGELVDKPTKPRLRRLLKRLVALSGATETGDPIIGLDAAGWQALQPLRGSHAAVFGHRRAVLVELLSAGPIDADALTAGLRADPGGTWRLLEVKRIANDH